MGKIVVVDDDLGLHLRIIGVTQDVSDSAFWPCSFGRVLSDLRNHYLIGTSPLRLSFRNIDLLKDSLILWEEVRILFGFHELAHDLAERSFQNSDDLSFPPFPPDRLHSGYHPISMHRLFEIFWTDEDIFFSLCFWNDETISVRMTLDLSHNQIHLQRKAVTVSSNPNDLSLIFQILQ